MVSCTRVPVTSEPTPAVTNTSESLEPAPTAIEPEPTAIDIDELFATPTPVAEGVSEPGGVDVALTLVTIPDQDAIAVVNGEEISTAAYQDELTRALYSVTAQYGLDWNSPDNRSLLPSFQDQVLDQIIYRTFLHQLADREGVSASAEEVDAEVASIQAQIQAQGSFADWDSFLAANNLTDELARELIADDLIRQTLAENHGGPRSVEQVLASHILVETEETGQEVLDKLDAGEEFGALAAEYSTDPGSKDQGGDLGWFPQGMMVPEFEEAAFALAPGETSGLVQSDFGFHIIQVHEKEEREMDAALYAQQQQQQFQAWYATQEAEASIERLFTFQSSE